MANPSRLGSGDAFARPGDGQEDETRFANFYIHCRREWHEEWSCTCNDRCPVCNHEIEPYASRDKRDKEPTLHVRADWLPEQGLPEGMLCVQELHGWPCSNAPQ